MKKIKVLRDANITYTKIIWNVPIEYDGNKYVIVVNEDDNGREETFYHYSSYRRYFAGEEVEDDNLIEELYEQVIDCLNGEGMLYSGMEEGYELEVDE